MSGADALIFCPRATAISNHFLCLTSMFARTSVKAVTMLLTSLYSWQIPLARSLLKGCGKSLNISKTLFGYYGGYDELNFVKQIFC